MDFPLLAPASHRLRTSLLIASIHLKWERSPATSKGGKRYTKNATIMLSFSRSLCALSLNALMPLCISRMHHTSTSPFASKQHRRGRVFLLHPRQKPLRRKRGSLCFTPAVPLTRELCARCKSSGVGYASRGCFRGKTAPWERKIKVLTPPHFSGLGADFLPKNLGV